MNAIPTDHGSVGSATENGVAQAATDCHYCYMFPDLAEAESHRPPDACAKYFQNLNRLAEQVDRQASDARTNSHMSAIYTYFGQFVNHDLSAPVATPLYLKSITDKAAGSSVSPTEVVTAGPDAVALMTAKRPPNPQWLVNNILNQHPEPLSLYSLYGSGPSNGNSEIDSLYDLDTMKFRLGQTHDDPAPPQRPQAELDKMLRHDLVRDPCLKVARIADRRNDENVVLGQLHLAFMLFHNRVIDALKHKYPNSAQLFREARSLVTRHYQYCIVHDFLKKLVPDEAVGSQVHLIQRSAVPFEFTTAAFRFGHSMISASYDYNRFFGDGGLEGQEATLRNLFEFTTRGNMGNSPQDNKQLPTHWVVDWARFLKVANTGNSGADHIDLVLPTTMSSLGDVNTPVKMADGLASISYRNLRRGYHRFMPTGQDLAAKLGVAPLTSAQIRSAFTLDSAMDVLSETGFDVKTPPWVYFLCEAKVNANGNALGPTAGAIVRGTIMNLLRMNPHSALKCEGGSWTPEMSPLRLASCGTIKDIKSLLQFAGVLG